MKSLLRRLALLVTLMGACFIITPAAGQATASPASSQITSMAGIHKIRHIIIVVQENHSFDNYFGTFPGADGIPMNQQGAPTVCVPLPGRSGCVSPFHASTSPTFDPPHKAIDARIDIAGGDMNGFLSAAARSLPTCWLPLVCQQSNVSAVLGYYTARDIPAYWAYAQNFVLQDHLFAPAPSYSLPNHLSLVSGWVASCSTANPMSCSSNIGNPAVFQGSNGGSSPTLPYRWTDITYLLHKFGVSWAYYDGSVATSTSTSAFNAYVSPLLGFQTVQADGQTGNIKPVAQFYAAARSGTLPAVSWVVPAPIVSEHPPYSIQAGQQYVTGLINALMQGPDWNSSAIFLTWDEWGGFYDHVVPPYISGMQLGLRVPGLVVSPYARRGYIDHQVLSFGSYLRFIEDDFLHGQRLNPQTDGRPDGRTVLSDAAPGLGNLIRDFNFNQQPRPPLLMPTSS